MSLASMCTRQYEILILPKRDTEEIGIKIRHTGEQSIDKQSVGCRKTIVRQSKEYLKI